MPTSPGTELPEAGAPGPGDGSAGRPGVVVAAFWVWMVISVALALTGLLVLVAAVVGVTDRGTALTVPLLGVALLVVAVGVGRSAFALRNGRRGARSTLTALAVLLALGGFFQILLRQIGGGLYLLASLVVLTLMYLPAANVFFPPPRGR